jgi:hypothetical protein
MSVEKIHTGRLPAIRGSRKPCIRPAAIVRAVKGVTDAGLPVVRVEVNESTGSISIITTTDAPAPKNGSVSGFESWD